MMRAWTANARRLVGTTVVAAALVAASPSSAFEYYEHRAATERGVEALCKGRRAKAPSLCKARDALLETVTPHDKRLTVGDFAAMAGDHAVSPPSLVWTFFIGEEGSSYLPNLNVLHQEAPENVEQSALDLHGFLDAIEALQPPRDAKAIPSEQAWSVCAAASKEAYDKRMMGSAASFLEAAKAGDFALIGGLTKEKLRMSRLMPVPPVDPNYLANAAHNASHFRIPASVSYEQLWARAFYRLKDDPRGEGKRNKPALHAISYYGDLHAGALILMRMAKGTKDKERRHDLLASAMVLETYALHFLQDSVAAGHLGGEAIHHLSFPAIFLRHDSDRVASAGSVLDASKRKNLHDMGNVEGRRVIVGVDAGRAVCGAKERGDVKEHEVEGAARLYRIYGDGSTLCGTEAQQPWLTRALLDAVTRTSLLEFDAAYKDKRLDHAAPHVLDDPAGFRDVTPCDLHTEPDKQQPVHRMHGITCQWWESHPEKMDEKAIAIRRVAAAGYFDALVLLPLPAHDDGVFARVKVQDAMGVDRATFCSTRGYR